MYIHVSDIVYVSTFLSCLELRNPVLKSANLYDTIINPYIPYINMYYSTNYCSSTTIIAGGTVYLHQCASTPVQHLRVAQFAVNLHSSFQ